MDHRHTLVRDTIQEAETIECIARHTMIPIIPKPKNHRFEPTIDPSTTGLIETPQRPEHLMHGQYHRHTRPTRDQTRWDSTCIGRGMNHIKILLTHEASSLTPCPPHKRKSLVPSPIDFPCRTRSIRGHLLIRRQIRIVARGQNSDIMATVS
jgi:hypothetical protein